jgi:hypothetical protein
MVHTGPGTDPGTNWYVQWPALVCFYRSVPISTPGQLQQEDGDGLEHVTALAPVCRAPWPGPLAPHNLLCILAPHNSTCTT